MLTSKLTLWREMDSFDTELLEKTINSYGFKLTLMGTRLKHNSEDDMEDFLHNMKNYNTPPTRQTMEDFWRTLYQGEFGLHTVYRLSYSEFKLCYVVLYIGSSFGPFVNFTSNVGSRCDNVAWVTGIIINKLENKLHSHRNKMYHYWIKLIRKNQLSIPLPLELVKIIMAMCYEL